MKSMYLSIIIIVVLIIAYGVWQHFSDPSTKEVLSAVSDLGEDVSKPHKITFHLIFSTEKAAKDVCEIIHKQKIDCTIDKDEDSTYEVIATELLLPNEKIIENRSKYYEELCKEFNGEYEEWGIETNIVIE